MRFDSNPHNGPASTKTALRRSCTALIALLIGVMIPTASASAGAATQAAFLANAAHHSANSFFGKIVKGTDCNNNSTPDDQENFNDPISGGDCNNDSTPDDCQGGIVDCNGNQTPDCIDDVSDCNVNGTPDSCEPDCNGNGTPDDCDIEVGGSGVDCDLDGTLDECQNDCNTDGTPDACEADCNTDGTPDECELDCNSDGTPDECELDCNSDGTPDECESDCNKDGTPDECEPDCNTNGTPDDCEEFEDCNGNDTPDECEPDCDSDGTPDSCEPDCNNNKAPDDCDIADGTSQDCNENGRPDECDIALGGGGPGGAGGPVIIGGDDSDDHGFFDGTNNVDGWLYIQDAFSEIGPAVNNGNKVAVCLGCNDFQAQDAFQSAFDHSGLSAQGWTRENMGGVSALTDFFNNTGFPKLSDAGIIYFPTEDDNVSGGISDEEIDVLNANAVKINQFVAQGGGLLCHDQSESSANGFGWLTTLIPGIEFHHPFEDECNDGTLNLTAAGAAAFPNIDDTTVSNATPWHAYFTGDFGGLQVLVTGPCLTTAQAVILGGAEVVIGGSFDCNENGIPDECEEDCNDNGIPDDCDIFFGDSADCDENGVPDECQDDCDGDGTPDECEEAVGFGTAGGAGGGCPSNITVVADGEGGATVNYELPGGVGPCDLTITADPPSGSSLPIGDTEVNVKGTASNGDEINCTFTVTVLPPTPAGQPGPEFPVCIFFLFQSLFGWNLCGPCFIAGFIGTFVGLIGMKSVARRRIRRRR